MAQLPLLSLYGVKSSRLMLTVQDLEIQPGQLNGRDGKISYCHVIYVRKEKA